MMMTMTTIRTMLPKAVVHTDHTLSYPIQCTGLQIRVSSVAGKISPFV